MFDEILKSLDWKVIALKVWEALEPQLEAKVKDSESQWDDLALNAVKVLVEKFLMEKPEIEAPKGE